MEIDHCVRIPFYEGDSLTYEELSRSFMPRAILSLNSILETGICFSADWYLSIIRNKIRPLLTGKTKKHKWIKYKKSVSLHIGFPHVNVNDSGACNSKARIVLPSGC